MDAVPELAQTTLLGILATIAGVAITARFQARAACSRRWKLVTASLALFTGLACALVWYRVPGAEGQPDGWALGFPFRALTAVEGRMLEATFSTAHLAFADFVAGVGVVHLASAWIQNRISSRRNLQSR